MTTNLAIVNSENTSSDALEAFRISTISATNNVDEAVLKAKLKEKETEIKGERPQGSSKLMPTSTAVANPIQSPAGLALLNNPAIVNAMSNMTPAQKTQFVDHLNGYLKSVNLVKAAMSTINPEDPAPGFAAVQNASLNVKQNVNQIINDVKDSGGSPLSIWYLLANFMANDIMGINEKEESAAMYQVEANAHTLESVNNGLAHLNPQLNQDHHIDGWKTFGFELACAVGAAIGVIAAPFTGGASLVLTAACVSIAIAFPVCNAEDGKKPAGKERFSFLSDDSADQQQLLEASISQSSWSNVGTQANQDQQTTMQIHVTQTSQIITQAAQEFSQMIQGAAQTANTSTR